MRDLFREGMKLGEALARLPWEAARRVTGGKSETLDRATDLGERLGTLPFRAAQRMVGDNQGAVQGQPAQPAPCAPNCRARIVVLGAGYAGLTCFLELQDHLGREYDVVLVNGDKYHWFTTELHTYVAGQHADTVRLPLRRLVTRPGRLVISRVRRVHPAEHQVELESGERLEYDYLVFALGSDPEYFGLPGVAENSLIIGNWQGASRVRERVDELMAGRGEEPPHVVVAGGGLTGVEVAAELAEEYPGKARITIVEAGPGIMGGFAPDLVQTARSVLEGKGIEIRAGNPIARVDPGLITFKDGATLACDLLVWAGGVRGSAILGKSGFETTPRGRGPVDPYLHAAGYENVYLVGDAAAFTDPATGRELPPTAQAAVQMGRTAGRNILRRLRGQTEEPFQPKIKGAFASLGKTEGVGMIGEEQYRGLPAMMIKHFIEAHHAWEAGGGVLPLVERLVRAPRHYLGGRPAPKVRTRAGSAHAVHQPAARPESIRRQG